MRSTILGILAAAALTGSFAAGGTALAKKATPTPTPKPKASASPTPKPKASPKASATATPKPKASPKASATATPKPVTSPAATATPAASPVTTGPTPTPASSPAAAPSAAPSPSSSPASAESAAPASALAPARIVEPPAGESPSDPAVTLVPPSVVNGGATLVVVRGLVEGDSVTGTFNGESVPFAAAAGKATALVGIDLDVKPGKYPVVVKVKRASGKPSTVKIELPVEDAKYEVEKLTLPKEKVTDFDPKTLARINKEAKALSSLWPKWAPERSWSGAFQKPVPGDVRSVFGGRRVINGEPRSPHAGIDQRGAEGTPIVAVNGARVAYVGNQFFSGNVTVLDHGHGVFTMYAHQSKIVVKEGDHVEAGQKIGEIGATGRATGPHLHWGVRVNGARVDPLRLLAALRRE